MTTRRRRTLSREQAWALSDAAYNNSKELVEAAGLLHSAGRFGPALSLAISAREEMGKFLAAMLVGVGVMSPEKFDDVRFNHSMKQAFGVLGALTGTVVDFQRSPFAEALDVRGVDGGRVFDVLNERLSLAAIESVVDADALAYVVKESDAAVDGSHEQERWRGIYTDVVDGAGGWRVSTPAEVTADEARDEINRARAHFEFIEAASKQVQVDPSVGPLTLTPEEFRAKLGDIVSKLLRPDGVSEPGQ